MSARHPEFLAAPPLSLFSDVEVLDIDHEPISMAMTVDMAVGLARARRGAELLRAIILRQIGHEDSSPTASSDEPMPMAF
jgi:hypothetical protein